MPEVRVSRRFDASAERVFNAWLDPAMIERFIVGPAVREEELVHIRVDARVGGRFSFKVMRGGAAIDHVGTYREIERPRRLVFTWGVDEEQGDLSVVTIEIAPLSHGCVLTLTHQIDPAWAEYAERTEAGWTHITGKLAEALTAPAPR
ncbi:MAG TPA: SRPBCC family protein [Terricaulis sp.]|nr:SRPBCC family protein [Terricaulis sp.]HRP10847.1 SRPBCC family protein [Terricaulis sp.]